MGVITVEELKKYRRLGGGMVAKQPENLVAMVKFINSWVENYCNRKFDAATYSETIFGEFPCTKYVAIENPPIRTLTAPTDAILLDGKTGSIMLAEAIREGESVTVEYNGGFTVIPEDLKLLCLRRSAVELEEVENARHGVESRAPGNDFGSEEKFDRTFSTIERSILGHYRIIKI